MKNFTFLILLLRVGSFKSFAQLPLLDSTHYQSDDTQITEKYTYLDASNFELEIKQYKEGELDYTNELLYRDSLLVRLDIYSLIFPHRTEIYKYDQKGNVVKSLGFNRGVPSDVEYIEYHHHGDNIVRQENYTYRGADSILFYRKVCTLDSLRRVSKLTTIDRSDFGDTILYKEKDYTYINDSITIIESKSITYRDKREVIFSKNRSTEYVEYENSDTIITYTKWESMEGDSVVHGYSRQYINWGSSTRNTVRGNLSYLNDTSLESSSFHLTHEQYPDFLRVRKWIVDDDFFTGHYLDFRDHLGETYRLNCVSDLYYNDLDQIVLELSEKHWYGQVFGFSTKRYFYQTPVGTEDIMEEDQTVTVIHELNPSLIYIDVLGRTISPNAHLRSHLVELDPSKNTARRVFFLPN